MIFSSIAVMVLRMYSRAGVTLTRPTFFISTQSFIFLASRQLTPKHWQVVKYLDLLSVRQDAAFAIDIPLSLSHIKSELSG